jgi:exonuclease SbcD
MSVSVILGDLHIGRSQNLGKPGIGSALNSRLVDQITILDWTLERCLDEMAENLILTGDIFQDAKPHPTVISIFVSWLKRCADSGLKVHICLGNHEVMRSGQFTMSAVDIISACEMENVFVYREIETIHFSGVAFTIMPYRDRRSFNTSSNTEATRLLYDKIPYELAEIDRNSAKVVVGHLAIEGSLPVGDEISDMGNEIFVSRDVVSGYDYTWMGHIHKPQVMFESPYIAHIGSMDLSDFGETDHQKVIVVFDPDAPSPYRYIDIPSRPLNRVSVSVPKSITNTTEFVINKLCEYNLDRSIIKIDVVLEDHEAAGIDRKAVEKAAYDKNAFHITRINEERKVTPLKQGISEKIDNTVNENSAISTYAHANVDDVCRNEFIALANSIVHEFHSKQTK